MSKSPRCIAAKNIVDNILEKLELIYDPSYLHEVGIVCMRD